MRYVTMTLFSAFIFLTLEGCSVNKELRKERKNWNYSNWGQEFKDRTLCLCVLQGFNNKSLQDSITKHDKSYYNPLAIGVFDSAINELLKKETKQIILDSISSVGRYPPDISSLLEGKRVMNHCIELYKSDRLDSLVKNERRNWKQISDIVDKIHEKIPTF